MTEPTTEAGKRLSDEAQDWDYFGDRPGPSLIDYVDAIEAEARAAVLRELREEVWRMQEIDDSTPEDDCIRRSGVLAAIDRRLA